MYTWNNTLTVNRTHRQRSFVLLRSYNYNRSVSNIYINTIWSHDSFPQSHGLISITITTKRKFNTHVQRILQISFRVRSVKWFEFYFLRRYRITFFCYFFLREISKELTQFPWREKICCQNIFFPHDLIADKKKEKKTCTTTIILTHDNVITMRMNVCRKYVTTRFTRILNTLRITRFYSRKIINYYTITRILLLLFCAGNTRTRLKACSSRRGRSKLFFFSFLLKIIYLPRKPVHECDLFSLRLCL